MKNRFIKMFAWILILFGGLGALSFIGKISINPQDHYFQSMIFGIVIFILGIFILKNCID